MQNIDNCLKTVQSPVEMALYEESCYRLRVLIVADSSDTDVERYTLHVLEDVGLFTDACAPAVGTQFNYQRLRDVYCYGMARLIRAE